MTALIKRNRRKRNRMSKKTLIGALILNLYIVISIIFCLIRFAVATGDGNMRVHGFQAFQFFTVDSNLLMAIISAITIYHIVKILKDPAHRVPHWLELLAFISVTSVAVTFVTVCVILGPAAGFLSMFTGNNFMLHLINPLAAIASFMFFTTFYPISWKQTPLAIISTMIYGIVYFYLVVALGPENGGWQDFYYFNAGGRGALSFIVMQIMAFLIGIGLRAVHNKCIKLNGENQNVYD